MMEDIFKIKSSEFIVSSASGKDIAVEDLPRIIFTGKSNVGKSSLINSVLNRKKLAKTGNTPGKTRLINFFLVNSSFYLVDLPGYGYASVSKTEKEKWKKMIECFLENTKLIELALSIIDIRHKPTANDLSLIAMFERMGIPQVIILNKKDKISNNVFFVQMKMFRELLSSYSSVLEVIPCSAVTGFGREKILSHIEKASKVES